MIYITSWQDLYPVSEDVSATHVISLLGIEGRARTPENILTENHLRMEIDDIAYELDGYVAPNRSHVSRIIEFGRKWDRQGPIICHCYAGISRSSAAALILLSLFNPGREVDAAKHLRQHADHVQPNRRMVRFADELLNLDGTLIAAAEDMGPGKFFGESIPTAVPIDLS